MPMDKTDKKKALIDYCDEPRTIKEIQEFFFDQHNSYNTVRGYIYELQEEDLLFEGPKRGKQKTYINYISSKLEQAGNSLASVDHTPGYKFSVPASYIGPGKISWPNLHKFLKLDPVANVNPFEILDALIFLATAEQSLLTRGVIHEYTIQQAIDRLHRILRVLSSITEVLVSNPSWRNGVLFEHLQLKTITGQLSNEEWTALVNSQWKIAVAIGIIEGDIGALDV